MLLSIIKSQIQPFLKASSFAYSSSQKYLQHIKIENSTALGGYSDAVKINSAANIVFCSGSIATHKDSTISVEKQTEIAMDYIKAILEAGNSDFSNVIKSSIFLTNIDDFAKVNEIYLKYFDKNSIPTGSVLAVKQLPKEAKVEIEVVACQKN